MPARTPERILASIVKQEGREAKVRRKLTANRDRNWLLGLTLNSFAKLTANAQLSDLEQTIIDTYRRHGFSDEQLKQHGRMYLDMPEQVRHEIFPDKFAQLTPGQRYSKQDLRNDASTIVSNVLSMPNVTRIDVQAIHAGNANLREFALAPKAVVQTHGVAMLVATEPNTAATASTRYTIKATSFRCNDETGTDFWDRTNRTGSSARSAKVSRSQPAARSSAILTRATHRASHPMKAVSGGRIAARKNSLMVRSARLFSFGSMTTQSRSNYGGCWHSFWCRRSRARAKWRGRLDRRSRRWCRRGGAVAARLPRRRPHR